MVWKNEKPFIQYCTVQYSIDSTSNLASSDEAYDKYPFAGYVERVWHSFLCLSPYLSIKEVGKPEFSYRGHSNNVSTYCLLFLKRSPLGKSRALLGLQRFPRAIGSPKKRGSSISCQKLSPNRNKLKTTETVGPSQETSNTGVLGSAQTPIRQKSSQFIPRTLSSSRDYISTVNAVLLEDKSLGVWGRMISIPITLNWLPNSLKAWDFSLIKWEWS